MTRQEELITRCKRGDPAAYTGLYNQHAAAVYNSILRLIVHTGEAEDILQESFVAAFQGIANFKEGGGFGAWVKRIAINKSIDLIRKRKLRYVELEPGWLPEEEPKETVDEVDFQYSIDAVNAAIATLPDGYRTIFNLYAIEQVPQAEIAQMLGLEHSAVRTQYHRAKMKIKEAIKQGGYYER